MESATGEKWVKSGEMNYRMTMVEVKALCYTVKESNEFQNRAKEKVESRVQRMHAT